MIRVPIMDAQTYKYDVAFSFLAEDEALAQELNDLLQDRLATFLYSRRQGELAGTDGELAFNEVFAEQSRMVVVLYRQQWGNTPWTRIEETAIRNRAYSEGFDFVKFIPLDKPPAVPRWLPKAQIWIGLERWGVACAASVIESRVQELGGEPREETAEDRAMRLNRALQFDTKRQAFRQSIEGVQAAMREFGLLCEEIERRVNSIKEKADCFALQTKRTDNLLVVIGLRLGLSVAWRCKYQNSLDGSALIVEVWDNHPPFPGIDYWEKPKRLSVDSMAFDLLSSGALCWTSSQRTFDSGQLGDHLLKDYLDRAAEYQNSPERDLD